MSRIGDLLEGKDDVFGEWFLDELRITNYARAESVPGSREWDSPDEKQQTPDSPITVRGQVDPLSAVSDSEPWARDIDADVVIFLADEVTISDGEEAGLPYQSDVYAPTHEETYRVTHLFREGNGLIRCLASSLPGGRDGGGGGS